jgi:hypothetical protein
MSANDVISRLDAAVSSLAGVDLGELSDAAIEASLDRLSMALCQVDVLLSRLADETRSRGFTITEGGMADEPFAGQLVAEVSGSPVGGWVADSGWVIEVGLSTAA